MTDEKIRLRLLTLSDTDTVFSMTSDPEVARYMRFDTHTERSQAEDLIREYLSHGAMAYLVTDAESGVPVGVAALKEDTAEGGEASLSLFFAKESWGKGYSTLAVRELVELAGQAGFRRVLGYVVEENIGSRRVLEKCGFFVDRILRFEDLQGGLYVYAIDFDGKMKERKA